MVWKMVLLYTATLSREHIVRDIGVAFQRELAGDLVLEVFTLVQFGGRVSMYDICQSITSTLATFLYLNMV
jgi:hypothetical protein